MFEDTQNFIFVGGDADLNIPYKTRKMEKKTIKFVNILKN